MALDDWWYITLFITGGVAFEKPVYGLAYNADVWCDGGAEGCAGVADVAW